MSTSLATRRLLLVSRAAPLRSTARVVLPRVASLALLRDAGVDAVRPFTVHALMRAAAAAATATAKKAGSKSKSAGKTAATKKKPAAAKKKPAAKAKAKKPKAKKAVRKRAVKKVVKKKKRVPLTEEQKEKREILKLKKMALFKGPARRPYTAWTVYVAQQVRKGEGVPIAEQMASLGSSFKNLPEAEKQNLQSIADANKADNEKALSNWIKSFPVEVIYMANRARKTLGKKLDKARVFLIHDARLPHRALTAYSRFLQERFDRQSGASNAEVFKEVGEQWRGLTDQEKAPYLERASAEAEKSSAVLKELKQKATAYWKEQAQAAA
ncbi:Non-histone chromosomal protein 6 [Escovopsis weberi]|uniref:Non-histone chromosomal protein 6 n=1 Tax=Escovopsis weberi TaxID=150374 RepID=A0A0M8MZR0_ESCWE|nr:Non-histone chromosomal protein 6 [Escovopsis weberi]